MHTPPRLRLPDRVSRFATLLVLSVASTWAAPTGFRDAVLADTPDAYYRLGETGGTVAAEAADPLLNGTYVGGPALGTAGSGTGDAAVAFSGTGQAVRLDNIASYGSRLATSSYEFVLRTTTTAQGFIFGQTNSGTATAVCVQFNTGASGTATAGATRFFLRAQDGTAYGASFINAALYGGGYVHLVFSYDRATGLKVYVNGVSQTLSVALNTLTSASVFANFTQPLHVAALNNRGTVTGYADVTLDEVALYPVALPATAVAAHYAALTAPPPGVIGLSTAHDFTVPA
ncbi:MAG TPA: LamG-like jellyroll fold domain-containing protein, partial [Rariglobus sp.]